jgi:hypothetical protein
MEDTTAIDAKAKSIGPLWKRVIDALGLAAGLIGSVTAIVTASAPRSAGPLRAAWSWLKQTT